jgi:hypothetical protein
MDYDQHFLNFSNFRDEIQTQISNLQRWENEVNNSSKNFVMADEGDE